MNHSGDETQNHHPERWMRQSIWQRCPPLRWLRNYGMERGIGYVRLSGDSLEFWRQAMRHSPVSFRWFGRSLNPDDLAEELSGREQWRIAMEQYQAGDKIWPFIINPNTLAMRLGYIIVRDGKPVTGVVTLVS